MTFHARPMNAIRSALHLLWMAISLIPWALAVLAAAPFVSRPRLYRMSAAWLALVIRDARWMLGIRHRIHGWEHLPLDAPGGAVLLVKHQSTWETFALPALLPRPVAFVFKRELLRIPFFGWVIGRLDMIHIDREQRTSAFRKVVQQGQRLLDQGTWIVMFPEGTRTPRGQQASYQSSGARLAIQCGVPVIPVAVTSARCWPPRAFVKRPGVIDISFGPPMATQGRKPPELIREVEQWIESEMRRLDPEAYPQANAAPVAANPASIDT